MAFTQLQVDKLEDAIANGATLVKYADKEVRYRSLDEMVRILALMKKSLGLIKPNSGRTYASFSKGTHASNGIEGAENCGDNNFSDQPWIY